jgi:hypothetical protein
MEFNFFDTMCSNSGFAMGKKILNIEIIELGSDFFKVKTRIKKEKET